VSVLPREKEGEKKRSRDVGRAPKARSSPHAKTHLRKIKNLHSINSFQEKKITYIDASKLHLSTYTYICMCMYVCIRAYMYIYVYICVYSV
jgi:hypothetical protein